jgi:anti-sigma B factor antagonist
VVEDRFGVEVTLDDPQQRTVALSGEIDLASAPAVWEAIEPVLEDASCVVVDLSDVRFIDSTGLSVLVRAHRRLGSHGGILIVRSPSETAGRVLRVTGLDTVFGLRDS